MSAKEHSEPLCGLECSVKCWNLSLGVEGRGVPMPGRPECVDPCSGGEPVAGSAVLLGVVMYFFNVSVNVMLFPMLMLGLACVWNRWSVCV